MQFCSPNIVSSFYFVYRDLAQRTVGKQIESSFNYRKWASGLNHYKLPVKSFILYRKFDFTSKHDWYDFKTGRLPTQAKTMTSSTPLKIQTRSWSRSAGEQNVPTVYIIVLLHLVYARINSKNSQQADVFWFSLLKTSASWLPNISELI